MTDSAGPGQWRGGLGVETRFVIGSDDTTVVTFGDGDVEPAFGLLGGGPGCLNKIELVYPGGEVRKLTSKDLVRGVPKGTLYVQHAGGGGGYGDPRERPRKKVCGEVRNGVISPADGVGPEDLKIQELLARLRDGRDGDAGEAASVTSAVAEVIVATNPNLEGEATAMYLARLIEPLGVRVGQVRELRVLDRSASGRALRLDVRGSEGNDEVQARALRAAVGADVIRSTLFQIRSDGDTFVFAGSFGADTITDFSSNDAEDIDLSGVANITNFTDLVMNHLSNNGGTAQIEDGANSILLQGVAFADVGVGQLYSEEDFIF